MFTGLGVAIANLLPIYQFTTVTTVIYISVLTVTSINYKIIFQYILGIHKVDKRANSRGV